MSKGYTTLKHITNLVKFQNDNCVAKKREASINISTCSDKQKGLKFLSRIPKAGSADPWGSTDYHLGTIVLGEFTIWMIHKKKLDASEKNAINFFFFTNQSRVMIKKYLFKI